MNETEDYLIIDENGRILDKFRRKATALQMIRRLREIHIGLKLTIVHKEDYENVVQNQQEAKTRLPCSGDEGWTQ